MAVSSALSFFCRSVLWSIITRSISGGGPVDFTNGRAQLLGGDSSLVTLLFIVTKAMATKPDAAKGRSEAITSNSDGNCLA